MQTLEPVKANLGTTGSWASAMVEKLGYHPREAEGTLDKPYITGELSDFIPGFDTDWYHTENGLTRTIELAIAQGVWFLNGDGQKYGGNKKIKIPFKVGDRVIQFRHDSTGSEDGCTGEAGEITQVDEINDSKFTILVQYDDDDLDEQWMSHTDFKLEQKEEKVAIPKIEYLSIDRFMGSKVAAETYDFWAKKGKPENMAIALAYLANIHVRGRDDQTAPESMNGKSGWTVSYIKNLWKGIPALDYITGEAEPPKEEPPKDNHKNVSDFTYYDIPSSIVEYWKDHGREDTLILALGYILGIPVKCDSGAYTRPEYMATKAGWTEEAMNRRFPGIPHLYKIFGRAEPKTEEVKRSVYRHPNTTKIDGWTGGTTKSHNCRNCGYTWSNHSNNDCIHPQLDQIRADAAKEATPVRTTQVIPPGSRRYLLL